MANENEDPRQVAGKGGDGRHMTGGDPGDQVPRDRAHMQEQLRQNRGGDKADDTPVTGPDDVFGSKGVIPTTEGNREE